MIKCSNTINHMFRNETIPKTLSLASLIENMRGIIVRNIQNPNNQEVQPVDYSVMCLMYYFSKQPIDSVKNTVISINGAIVMDPKGKNNKFACGGKSIPPLMEAYAACAIKGHVIIHHKFETYIYIDIEGSDQITTYATKDCLTEAIMLGKFNPDRFFGPETGFSIYREVLKDDHKDINSIVTRLVVIGALPQHTRLNKASIVSELQDYLKFIGELIAYIGTIMSHLYVRGKYDIEEMDPTGYFDIKDAMRTIRKWQAKKIDLDTLVMYSNDIAMLQCMLGVVGVNILDLLDQEFIEVDSGNLSYHPYVAPSDIPPTTNQNYS